MALHQAQVSSSAGLARLCAAGFVAYCSYAICRAPLLPLFARDLGAGPSVIGLVVGAQFVLNGALNAFLPLFGREVVGLTTPQLGWLFAAQTVTTLMIRPVVGALSDRVGRRGVIVAGLTVCSAAVWALSMTAGPWALATTVVTYVAGVATTSAATSAFITDSTQRARFGAAHGVFGTIYDIGDALGPIGAGLLVATLGYAPMFQCLAVLGVAMAVVFAVASRPGAGVDPSASQAAASGAS